MTLLQLLSTLDSVKVMATIYEADKKTLVSEIRACTYQSLDDAIEAREVTSWSINNNNLTIILKAAE